MSAAVAKWELDGRGISFDCKDECCEDMGQWDSQVFADSRGTGMMDPFPTLSELIAARVPIPPSAPVLSSDHAISYPAGCHLPAPGSLPPRLFDLPDSAQHSCPPQQPYPHLLSGLPVFIMVPFLPQLPVFLPSASLSLHPLHRLTLLYSSLRFPCSGKLSPIFADTTRSLSSCIFSWAPRTLPRPLPIPDSPLQGWSAQPKDATAGSSGGVQHRVCALREKHERS